MLTPSGWSKTTSTRAPSDSKTAGATVLAAPLAQSSTTCSPSSRRPFNARITPWRYSPAALVSATMIPTSDPLGRIGGCSGESISASSSFSMACSISTGSFVP